MYCSANVDLGWGSYDYAYGVSVCDNGNLRAVSSAQLANPVPVCSGTYSRARQDANGGYQQFDDPQPSRIRGDGQEQVQ